MKVAYLTGGHPVHDDAFVTAIRMAGHSVTVTRVPQPGPANDDLAHVAIDGAIRAKPDVIHAGPIQDVAAVVADLGGHPLVAASWGFDLVADTADVAGRARAVWALERSSVLIVDCRAAGRVATRLGMNPARIITLPWGVDLRKFRPAGPSRSLSGGGHVRSDDRIVVLTARQHEPVYGVDVVIEGFILAALREPRLELVVIGQGSLTEQLKARVSVANLWHRIRFVGAIPHDELPAWMAAADVYVSGSHVDGSSVTLLEAMATGLPAIVSDIAGNREWVRNGRSGSWFPDGDADALAAALTAIAATPRVRRLDMGALGRRTVESRADWHANLTRLWHAYALATGTR